MNLNTLGEDIDNLDPKQRKSILNLIQTYSDTTMEKVINKLDVLENKWTISQKELATSQNALKSELSSKLTTAYWVVGIAWATIATLLTIIALKP